MDNWQAGVEGLLLGANDKQMSLGPDLEAIREANEMKKEDDFVQKLSRVLRFQIQLEH
ncbi:unnamed protein product, partial [Amoebophrya sp. A25]|eukprot:GSA25T00012997001.1